jgi:pimeloyl-ACP methyl ester carboxylesterase
MFVVLQALSTRLAARIAFVLFLKPSRRKLGTDDTPFMAEARLHQMRCGDDVVPVYEWGACTRTVVIVHGWGSRASRFAPMARALVANGWRVLAFDAPAHGAARGRSSSLPQFIHALNAVVEQHGPVHALIGHSLGALAIACQLGAAGPYENNLPRKIVLISMPSGAPFLTESFVSMFGINVATAQRVRALFIRRFGATPETFSALPGAAKFDIPVLLVHDGKDDVVPLAQSEQLVKQLRHGRLHVTEGLGHSGLVRDADAIRAIGNFFDNERCSAGR